MKKLKIAAVTISILIVLSLFFTGGYFFGQWRTVGRFYEIHPTLARQKLSGDFKLLDEIARIIEDQYVEKVSKSKLVEGAIKGMLGSLDDPYTKHFKPKDFEHIEEMTEGRFEGVGMTLDMEDSQVVVVAPIEGTPASRAGIKHGDKILEVDGKSTKGLALEKVVSMIKGKSGTKVTLTIGREGQEPFKVTLVREEINIPNIKAEMKDSDIGYIRLIHTFNSNAGPDVRKTVTKLKSQGAKGIILDLRNNPGGLLEAGVEVAGVFIDRGVIVSIKGRKGDKREYKAKGDAFSDIPLVVLVNKGSASASEIVAGAIQDYGRGVIVGEKTFGKGSVQTIIDLSDGSGLIITTARYYTPKGRSINKTGIAPDVVVTGAEEELEGPQLEKAKEILHLMIEGKDWKQAA